MKHKSSVKEKVSPKTVGGTGSTEKPSSEIPGRLSYNDLRRLDMMLSDYHGPLAADRSAGSCSESER